MVRFRTREEILEVQSWLVRSRNTNRRIIGRCCDILQAENEVESMSKITETAPPNSNIAAGTSLSPLFGNINHSCKLEQLYFIIMLPFFEMKCSDEVAVWRCSNAGVSFLSFEEFVMLGNCYSGAIRTNTVSVIKFRWDFELNIPLVHSSLVQ